MVLHIRINYETGLLRSAAADLSINAHIMQPGPVFFTAVDGHKSHVALLPFGVQIQPDLLALGMHTHCRVQAVSRQHRQHCTNLQTYCTYYTVNTDGWIRGSTVRTTKVPTVPNAHKIHSEGLIKVVT